MFFLQGKQSIDDEWFVMVFTRKAWQMEPIVCDP